MPPKPSAEATLTAKRTLIHTHLLRSLTCHTLKDLEKSLPAALSGISSQTVKEHINALVADDLVRVEKIGAGNWYWAFASDARIAREREVKKWEGESEKARASRDKVKEEVGVRSAVLAAAPSSSGLNDDGVGDEAESLKNGCEQLRNEVKVLKWELDQFAAAGSEHDVQRMRNEVSGLRVEALDWTEKIWVLEEWVSKATGGDREQMEAIRRSLYAEEYIEGEGLAEM